MGFKYIGYFSRWSPVSLYEKPIPSQLNPNDIVVDVSYLGLNPIDIKLKSIAVAPIGWQVGEDFSGVIQAVGSAQACRWKVGQRVCGAKTSALNGVVGTKAILDVTKQAVMETPKTLSDAQAAAFPVTFGTAAGLSDKTSKRGNLLVLGGASNVGTYAIQLAKLHYKFDQIVATCSSSSNDFVRSIGADKTVDYHASNVSQQLKDLNIKFDAIVDTVGGYDALKVWPDILKSYKEGGVYATVAGDYAPAGSYKHALVMPTLKSLPWVVPRMLFGRFVGINYTFVTVKPGHWTKSAKEFFETHDVKIPIDSEFPLGGYQQAWNHLENMKAKGKVSINMKQK